MDDQIIWSRSWPTRGLKVALTVAAVVFAVLWIEAIRLGLGFWMIAGAQVFFGLVAVYFTAPAALALAVIGSLALLTTVAGLVWLWRRGFVHLVALEGEVLLAKYDGLSHHQKKLDLGLVTDFDTSKGLDGETLFAKVTRGTKPRSATWKIGTYRFDQHDLVQRVLLTLRQALPQARLRTANS